MSNSQPSQVVTFGDRRRSAPNEAQADLSPWDVLRGLWARKEVIALVFAAAMALCLIWLATTAPVFTAETRILLAPRTGEVSAFDSNNQPAQPDDETVQSEIQLITSRPLIEKLIQELHLDRMPAYNPALRSPGLLSFITGAETPSDDLDQVVANVLAKLSVYRKATSRVIAIEFSSGSAELAAAVPNKLADIYIGQQIADRENLNRTATGWLAGQIKELRAKVQESEAKVEAFRTKSGLFITNGSTLPRQQLTDLNSQLSVAEADQAAARAKLQNAQSLLASGGKVDSAVDVLQSPLIQQLRQQEVQLKAQIAQLSETLLPTHPKMRQMQANLADLESQIRIEVRKIVEALRNEAKVADARVASLRSSLSRLKQRMGQLNQDEVTLRALERDAASNRKLLEDFLQRYQEANARAEADVHAANARIVSRAQTPAEPSFPKAKAALTFSIVASLIAAIMVAFLMEVFSAGFRSGEEAERITGMPFLGLIPALSGPEKKAPPAGHVVYEPFDLYSEAIRALQGNVLLARVGDRRARSVLVTSAHADEGKTATAASLARVFAMGGYRTIVIDADLRAPGLHKAMGLGPQYGLSDLLMGRVRFEHVIRQDIMSTAHVIQAGSPVANPTAAIASSQMLWVLSALQQTYDIVIVDSPAALAAADAQVLSKMTDVTVLAVRWASTSRRVVARVLKMLSAASSRRVGVLLTRVDMRRYRRYSDTGLESYPARPVSSRERPLRQAAE